MNSPVYKALLALSAILALAGLATLLPNPGASWPNVMGYRSLCTFAPAGTLYCFFLAGLTCFFRASLVKEREGSAASRLKKHGKALAVLAAILILAFTATAWHLTVKSAYPGPDAGSAASAEPDAGQGAGE